MKRGFTLIELMVVIGIIGILAAILLKATGGSSDSARAAKCLGNMHALATACQAVGMSSEHYPPAGSWEYRKREFGKQVTYGEVKGWVSWGSQGAYPNGSTTAPKAGSDWYISTYFQPRNKAEREWRHHALTNGAIWRAVSGNADTFLCPLHVKLMKKQGLEPLWSYAMNSYFGWAGKASPEPKTAQTGRGFGDLKKAERVLLLSELPFNEENQSQTCKFTTTAGLDLDPTLQYEDPWKEVVGVNHKRGRKWYAHVCFADGHAESLEVADSSSKTQLQKLTEALCTGLDVDFSSSTYQELK